MGKFAKVFDIDDDVQVLIQIQPDEEEDPCLKVTTEVSEGVFSAVDIFFAPEDGEEYDIEKAWNACFLTFSSFGMTDAVELRKTLVKQYHDGQDETEMTDITYDPKFGDDKLCVCGHTYYRHFDSYEDMEPVGCKYCQCMEFEESNLSNDMRDVGKRTG